ncbi:NAD(P)/FAD-dependent oxidoreductase [Kangiella koreensis]|uniref:Tryptophan halogenase n=1 Tax=Kangiella koreensis (strain DSM 16069 / JCM 12317 / KCTC 12182 / SW-125) TaxID=523791 RepID=C7R9X3_KANKD|nr:NAD(P)/FAD-dependent oxidoreductase [Kangiella koreensis]ACV27992.1 tryptophan halogenase [Kangiella koreensis DSM 16069]
MPELNSQYDVIIIGAGPAGSLAASLLTQNNVSVLVVEKQHFPRFSIGESLLPQSMVYLQEANMVDAIKAAAPELGFQYKDGAAFFADNHPCHFDFGEKFTPGPGSTFQVKRAPFDQLLAQVAEQQGATFCFGQQVTQVRLQDPCIVTLQDEDGTSRDIQTRFILDASGFAKVLPRLLDLTLPSTFPVRSSVFCHVQDNIDSKTYDRNKILIETHPQCKDVWYWLIPFADGTASVGCVAKPDFFEKLESEQLETVSSSHEHSSHEHSVHEQWFDEAVNQSVRIKQLLATSTKANSVQYITAYSSNVKQLFGERYALLGNAGEFLDPIFSSGVTIAFKSAKLATDVLLKQLNDEDVCWQSEFADPLQQGVQTFKAFVESWYQGQLQDIIHFDDAPENIREMVCSILAGYAWDTNNPFVKHAKRRLNTLGQLCATS